MKLHSLAIAAVLAAAFGSASAEVKDIELKGGPVNWSADVGNRHHVGAFSDTFTFTDYSAAGSIVSSSLLNTANGPNSITFTGATLNGVELKLVSALGLSGYTFTNLHVTGPLTLVVSGIVNGSGNATASYGGDFNVSAVPEPATYGMLLGGMGVLAFAARRRTQ